MKHTYSITGMTCNGCRAGVEEKLRNVAGVIDVSVSLENSEAQIEMSRHIATADFQKALPEKYTISEKKEQRPMPVTTEQKSEWRQLFPLFLILGYLTTAAVLLNRDPFNADGFMLDFMGLFYIVFSFFKLLDLKGFPDSFRMYDPLAKIIPVYARAYPFVEAVLGLCFLMRFQIEAALIATVIVLGITTVGVTKVLLDKRSIQCACLGTALKLPMTKATFIENSLMIVMAIVMLTGRN